MQKAIRYTIFKTKWGYFGLAGTEYGLLRTSLPLAEYERVKFWLLKGLANARFEQDFFKALQERITAYFEGAYVNFDRDIPIITDGLSGFACSVLDACRDIRFGQTISYGRLAERVGRVDGARAVGNALARNPLPLVIACHRVVCANGKMGGFSATGGVTLKKRMLELEEKSIKSIKMGSLGKGG